MNLLLSHLQQKYQDARILILGFGREGKSTLNALSQIFPDKTIAISDQNSNSLRTKIETEFSSFTQHITVEEYLQNLSKYDVIFKTPGIPVSQVPLQAFVAEGKTLTSQMNEFLEVYKKQVIGVTGTKGKSTTSSLIHHVLQYAGIPTILAGNIGTPVFERVEEIRPKTQVVIEMSSYHLETTRHSPHIAVFLNIFPEHLNYHGSMEKYFAAKAKITEFQTAIDIFVYNESVPEILSLARRTKAQICAFSPSEQLTTELFPLQSLEHISPVVQKNNVPPAVQVCTVLGLKKEVILDALSHFAPLAHRLEKVGTYKEITFIDDTLATIPEATCAALDVLKNVSVIMLGGFDRGITYDKVVDKVIEKGIPTVVFFKTSGEKMFTIMKMKYPSERLPEMYVVDTMQEAVELAYQHATPDSIVLLSPASPSFGTFKDYEDKSAQFVHWMRELGQT